MAGTPSLGDIGDIFNSYHAPAQQAAMNYGRSNAPTYTAPANANPGQLLKSQLASGAINRQQFITKFASLPGDSTNNGFWQRYSPANVGSATGHTLAGVLQAVPRAATELGLSLQPRNNAIAPAAPNRAAPTFNINKMAPTVKPTMIKSTPSVVNATNPLARALLGKTPVTSIQAQRQNTIATHPGGFHLPGTNIKLSPETTGNLFAAGKTALDVTAVDSAARGLARNATKLGNKITGNGHEAKFVNHVQSWLAQTTDRQAANAAATKAGMGKLSQAEATAKTVGPQKALPAGSSSTKLLSAPADTSPKLLKAGGPNFTVQSVENKRVMDGTAQLVKQYEKEYTNLTKAYADSPKRLQSEVNKLDTIYQGKHSDLLSGVGDYTPKAPQSPLATAISKAQAAKANGTPLPASAIDNHVTQAEAVAKQAEKTTSSTTPAVKGNVAQSDTTPVVPTTRAKVVQPATNPTNVSKVAKSVESNSLANKITNSGFDDLAGYNKKTVADQASKVADLVTGDTERARAIVRGEKPLPSGMSGSMFIKGVEEHAIKTGDHELLRALAKSPITSQTSAHAQELRLLRERSPNSPAARIQEVLDARAKAAEARLKQPVTKAVESTAKEAKTAIKAATPKVTKMNWSEFVSSIAC